METYNKQNINRILNSDLVIHWWNFTRKTIDFKGTVKDYLIKNNIKYTVKCTNDNGFEIVTFKVRFSVGSLNNICFVTRDFEDVIRMAINIKLSYIGDKSKYTLLGRTRSINF